MHNGQRHITDTDQYYARTPSFDRLDMPAQQRMVEAHQILEQVAHDNTPSAPVEVKMARDLGKLETMLDQAWEKTRIAEDKLEMEQETKKHFEARSNELYTELQKVKKERDEWEASSDEYKRLYDNYIAKQRKRTRRR